MLRISRRKRPLAGLALAACAAVALLAAPAEAARKKPELKRRTYLLSRPVAMKLLEVQELMEAEQYPPAKLILEGLSRKKRLNPLEVAQIHQMLGYIAFSASDYPAAAEEFEKCLAAEGLTLESEHKLRFNLAQLYGATEQFDRAVATLEQWFKDEETPQPPAYYQLAIAYYQSGSPDKALEPARQAVELSSAPKEKWLQLLGALYFENQNYPALAGVLEMLVNRYPRKPYFNQLAGVYAELEHEQKSLAVQQLAYLNGFLEEDKELRRLARNYLYHEIPYWAALILERGITDERIESDADAWELLANSWISAREYEKAIAPLETAAKLSEDGELYVRLGQVFIERDQWGKARVALQQALERELENRGRAFVLLGLSNWHEDRVDAAQSAFRQAVKFEKYAKEAGEWLNYIEKSRAAARKTAATRASEEPST